MISINDQLIDMAKQVAGFGGRVYRAYPQTLLLDRPYCIVRQAGRSQELTENGEEVMVSLTFNVSVYDTTPDGAEDLMADVINIYNRKRIQNVGYGDAYLIDNDLWTVSAVFQVKVDRRGNTYW